MKKYFTSLIDSKAEHSIEIIDDKRVNFNGATYSYEYKFINDHILILRINDRNYFLAISESESNNVFDVNVDSKLYKVICKSQLDAILDKMSNNESGKRHKNEIHSPMPGIINKLNVKENQKVIKGDVLLVLEAMKMENEIRATKDYIVKKVCVQVMKSVEKGELLMVLE